MLSFAVGHVVLDVGHDGRVEESDGERLDLIVGSVVRPAPAVLRPLIAPSTGHMRAGCVAIQVR